MAMRVRWINGSVVALCAAEHPEKEGDLYIDDAQDHAIRVKLRDDWMSEGYMFNPRNIVVEKDEGTVRRLVAKDREDAATEHDVSRGPCKCGAWH